MTESFDCFFKDRVDAGIQLSERLYHLKSEKTVVLAVPRGGVVVGFEVAKKLDASLSIIIPRKIGAPGNSELAIGAVTEDGESILDLSLVSFLGVDKKYIEARKIHEMSEIKRRMRLYLGDKPRTSLKDRIIVIVDDGLATGATMKAAVKSTLLQEPAKVVIAVPVAPVDTIEAMKKLVDEVVCLCTPKTFFAIGQFYQNFSQVEDDEVISLLKSFESFKK